MPDPQAPEPYTQLLGHTWPGDTRISPEVLGWWGAWAAQPVTLGLLRRRKGPCRAPEETPSSSPDPTVPGTWSTLAGCVCRSHIGDQAQCPGAAQTNGWHKSRLLMKTVHRNKNYCFFQNVSHLGNLPKGREGKARGGPLGIWQATPRAPAESQRDQIRLQAASQGKYSQSAGPLT